MPFLPSEVQANATEAGTTANAARVPRSALFICSPNYRRPISGALATAMKKANGEKTDCQKTGPSIFGLKRFYLPRSKAYRLCLTYMGVGVVYAALLEGNVSRHSAEFSL